MTPLLFPGIGISAASLSFLLQNRFEISPRQIIAKRRAGKAVLASQVLSSYSNDHPVYLSA